MANTKSADIKAGLLFVALGVFLAAHTLRRLELGSLGEMGPGFFPLCLCVLLAILGAGILVKAEAVERTLPSVNARAVTLVTAAPIAFGLAVRNLGLLPALLVTVALAVLAGRPVGWRRGGSIVVGVTLFCIGVFKWALDVPFDLVNPAWLD